MYITLLSFHIVTLFFFLPEYVYMYVYIYIYMLLLLHLNSKIVVCYCYFCCYSFFFMRAYMWLRERDWWWCSGKREKLLFFFFFLALFRSYLIDAIFDDDVLSLFSFPCRWDSICSLKTHSTSYDSTRRVRTRQDNCVHYWNKWSCYTTSEQNDGRERRRRRRRRDE